MATSDENKLQPPEIDLSDLSGTPPLVGAFGVTPTTIAADAPSTIADDADSSPQTLNDAEISQTPKMPMPPVDSGGDALPATAEDIVAHAAAEAAAPSHSAGALLDSHTLAASDARMASAVATRVALDERILPLRMTPLQRPRRLRPLLSGGLAGAALLILLPAVLAATLWPALGVLTPFGAPPDRVPRGASAWAMAARHTPLDPANSAFGAQAYPVDEQFAASYAARGGQAVLGVALTPAFTCNLGLVQFFMTGALLHASGQATGSAPHAGDLDPDLLREGDSDAASGVVWLPLSHTLFSDGSAAPIGGAGSAVTYATLRAATQMEALEPKPDHTRQIKANAPLPQTIVIGQSAFVIEGSRAGKLVGHSIPAPTWAFINQPQVAPHGWLRDIGEPLTAPVSLTITSNGQQRHLLAQAFWQTIIVTDVDQPQATAMQPIGLDYLRTVGAPAAHPHAGMRLWTTQDGALRSAPGANDLAVSLNTNAAITLTGAAQWNQGALWYGATWSSPSRHGTAWVAITSLSATQPGSPTTAGFDALSLSLAGYLNSQGDAVGAVVYDVTRNITYSYHPTEKFTMASSAKVPLLVAYLAYIEGQGRGPNGYEVSVMTAMIENSDNNAAQVIYDTIGYDAGQQSYMRAWGIGDYASDPNGWGWGQWSPADMAHLLALLQSGQVLNGSDRALALNLMQRVESDQRFGVGDTAPGNATVAMKDGWVPEPDGAWAVNTSGIVTIGGETYIVTVYTKQQNSFGSGQDIVNHVCAAVAQALK